jgi:sialic acid synthase SpsE/sugar phosphate isomerase/epimerase
MKIDPLIVGDRKIGQGNPTFVIAEAGLNHNGSLARAFELIDAAADAGADAVKFQKRSLADVYQKKILDNPNSAEQKYQYLIPLLKEFELSDEEYLKMEARAKEKNIIFMVNPWDKKSCDMIENLLHVPVYKVGSPDFTNNELLEYIAKTKKPMIVSTGMAQEEEIKQGVEFIKTLGVPFAILHCNSTYPAPFKEINLKYMDTLNKYGVPVGYSGHERGIAVSIGAVARGASIIERHITTDKNLEGPDHKASLLPQEFKDMVAGIREVEVAVGEGVKKLSRGEIMNREMLGKSVVAKTFIADGTVITRDMLTTMSPAKGLSPQRLDELIGITACRDIPESEAFTEDDIAGASLAKAFSSEDIAWKWGPVVRWKDFQNYLEYTPDLFEFHLSDKDLDEEIPVGKFTQEVVVHAPEYMKRIYLNPASEDIDERKAVIKILQQSIDIARKLGESFQGTPKFIVHPGGITLTKSDRPEKLLELFADTLSQLKHDGVEVLPENLPPRPWVFGGEWVTNIFMLAPEIKKFLEETGYSMCFDTSHSALSCNAYGEDLVETIKILQPYIHHLHVADGSGTGEEGLQIGQGTVDFAEILAPLAGYKHTMVPEIWQGHLHGGRGFLQAMTHLKPLLK